MKSGFQMPKTDAMGLYGVPEDYEAFLGADGSDEGWYCGLLRAGDEVLDLGCGTGRLSLPLARLGARVCGVDSSPAMLGRARARGAAAGLSVQWRLADWRSLDLGAHFSLAILPYNGLQHLLSLEDLRAFLRALQAQLRPAARFALDLHVPQAALLARDPEDWYGVEDGPWSPGEWRVLAEQSRWDPIAQVLTQRWQLGGPEGGTRLMELPLRQYFPQELRALLEGAGFHILSHEGGFQGQALAPGSLRQVVLAQRLE
jgi:SAM-dependent methyltransferase